MSWISTERLARAAATSPKKTVAAWIVAFLVAGALAGTLLQDNLSTQWRFLNTPESKQADNLIEQHIGDPYSATEAIVVQSSSYTSTEPEFRQLLSELSSDLDSLGSDVVASVTQGPVSEDGKSAIVLVRMAGNADHATETVHYLHDLVDEYSARDGFELAITGNATLSLDFTEISERDLQTGEAIGIPFALIVLLLVFGAVVASLVPLMIAVFAIVISMGAAALIGEGFQLSIFVVNVATMMGLAVGIDYSLFIIERYREERDGGHSVIDAIGRAGGTASRAVLFSGLTVVLAVTGLFFVPTDLFWSLAIGAGLVVMISVIASLTLLPAVISLLGDRINRLKVPLFTRKPQSNVRGGFWYRLADVVMGNPVLFLVVGAGVLMATSIPYFGITTGLAGVSTMPEGSRSREGFEVLDREFSGGLTAPVLIVIDADINDPELAQRLLPLAQSTPGTSISTSPDGAISVVSLTPPGDSASLDAARAIRELRSDTIPQVFGPYADDVYVTGWAARQTDFTDVASDRQIPVLAFVLGLSFLLLMLVFRSILVPLKAVVMNLLSVGATYGLLVLVFQEGVGNELFGFQQVDVIESWLPIFLFAILFGLSMDYHVFLLSRIRERFDQTQDNTESVAFGLRSTGRLITGAALIMVFVFSGFAAGDMTMFQQMGFGLAVAVLLDATLVRSVLVPATMRLLGPRNWYLPSALSWLPELNIEGSSHTEEQVVEQ